MPSVSALDPSASTEPGVHAHRESQAWLDGLNPTNPDREPFITALHSLLLKAARFELGRRRAAGPHLGTRDREDLAQQSADDALIAILGKLADFRGESRFTTWAYKFALLEAAQNARRCAWRGRELPLTAEGWTGIGSAGSSQERDLETTELFAALGSAIRSDLSPHQRGVLVAATLNDVPIDVLAERLETTRGALYKTIHDARRRLRAALAARGFSVD